MNSFTWWKIKNYLFRVTHPAFWIQVGELDWEWDTLLNRLLDAEPKVSNVSRYTCRLNGMTVWISNYPHSYGAFYTGLHGKESGLPAPITRKRLYKYVSCYRNKQRLEMYTLAEESLNRE